MKASFNPCFNGITSSTMDITLLSTVVLVGFNPCFNGITSSTMDITLLSTVVLVGFNPCFIGITSSTKEREDALLNYLFRFQSLF